MPLLGESRFQRIAQTAFTTDPDVIKEYKRLQRVAEQTQAINFF